MKITRYILLFSILLCISLASQAQRHIYDTLKVHSQLEVDSNATISDTLFIGNKSTYMFKDNLVFNNNWGILYSSSNIRLNLAGSPKFRVTTAYIDAYNNAGWRLNYGTVSKTLPNILPFGNDEHTGIGYNATDQGLSIISQRKEAIRATKDTTYIKSNGVTVAEFQSDSITLKDGIALNFNKQCGFSNVTTALIIKTGIYNHSFSSNTLNTFNIYPNSTLSSNLGSSSKYWKWSYLNRIYVSELKDDDSNQISVYSDLNFTGGSTFLKVNGFNEIGLSSSYFYVPTNRGASIRLGSVSSSVNAYGFQNFQGFGMSMLNDNSVSLNASNKETITAYKDTTYIKSNGQTVAEFQSDSIKIFNLIFTPYIDGTYTQILSKTATKDIFINSPIQLKNILPITTNVYEVGGSLRYFKRSYISKMYVSEFKDQDSNKISVYSDLHVQANSKIVSPSSQIEFGYDFFFNDDVRTYALYPYGHQTRNLGLPLASWKDIYARSLVSLKDTTYIKSNGQTVAEFQSDSITLNVNDRFIQFLGGAFNDVNFEGKMRFKCDGNAILYYNTSNLITYKNIAPNTDNLLDLGLSGTEFKDLYLQGSIYSNDNTLTIDPSVTFNRAVQYKVDNSAIDITLDDADHLVTLDGSAAAVTASIPNATTCAGRRYILKATDITFAVIAETVGGENIDTAPIYTFTGTNEAIEIMSDGTEWQIISKYSGT